MPINSIQDLLINPWTIAIVVLIIFGCTLWCAQRYSRGTSKAVRAFSQAKQSLGSESDQQSFADNFETISANLAEDPVVGARWKDYRHTLLVTSRDRPVIKATAPAADWFNLDILRAPAIGLDPRFHAVLPGLLVGAGLFFTFLGLAIALSKAGNVVQGNAIERNEALRQLLEAATLKFITSLAGLFSSIAYTIFQKSRLRSVEMAIDAFVTRLESLVPSITPVLLQARANDVLEAQLERLEAFSSDLAVNIGEAMDTSFNKRLAEHVEPLTAAIDRLSSGLSSGNQGAIEQMLTGFVDRLQGGAGAQVNAVAENLSGLGQHLSSLQSGFSEAAARMTASAEAMTNRMSDGAAAIQSRIDMQAEASGARMAAQIEAMVGELRELANQSRSTGEEALGALATELAAATRGFEATANRVAETLQSAADTTGGALGKGAEEAVERIATATEGMRAEITAMTAELKAALGEAGVTLREGGAAGGAALQQSVDAASGSLFVAVSGVAERIAQAGTNASQSLEQGGRAAADHLGSAAGVFGDRAGKLANEVVALARTAESLARRFGELDQATANVIAPLSAASVELRTASQAAREAATPLSQVGGAAARALEQVGASAQRFEAAAAQAGSLTGSLDAAAKRFEGVDQSLSDTLKALQDGLRGFTSEISAFVSQTDTNLTKVANQLLTAVRELDNTIETFNDIPRAG